MFIFHLSSFILFTSIFIEIFSISKSRLIINNSFHDNNNNNNNSRSINNTNIGKRKCEIKCNEYREAMTKKIWMMHPSEAKPFAISVECKPPIHLLISGGESARSGEFAHMAAIGWRNRNDTINYFCGGSLISENWVLTAAHCTRHRLRGKPSIVRLGSHQLRNKSAEIFNIIDIIRHPEYKPPTMYGDIALLKLHKFVKFHDNLRPACLYLQLHKAPKAVWATGWGQTEIGNEFGTDDLMKVRLDIINNEKCTLAYNKISIIPNGITSSMICAGDLRNLGGRDTCKGDSGGPLQTLHESFCLYEIVGITSFGKLCATPKYPGVYTRISYYLDWIEKIVWP